MHNILIIFILSILCFNAYSQQDTLYDKYKRNKIIPPCFLPEFCIALSYYPELQDAKVLVKRKNIKCTMVSRMTTASYFRKKSNRTYLLIIDTLVDGTPGLYDDLYLNARVGLIGHELAHLTDYTKRNFFGMVRYGIGYVFNKREIEQRTDEITIKHGLGPHLKEYTKIAFDPKKVSKSFYQRKMKYYYNPQQLEELIQKTSQQ